ncbi:hypothetical protein BCh11DRAFT_06080 [Burkholderia sp. Ch1-1]|nr:hypothetical protein BCh11DRAFT_06080 [Burkholderia sp. Ch1-1]
MFREIEVIEARELRSSAYHEAAHKVICERFGGRAYASIWRNESNNPDESAWLGTCDIELTWMINAQLKVAGIPQRHWRPVGLGRVRVPLYADEYIAMAGMIAELIIGDSDDQEQYDNEADANSCVEENLYYLIWEDNASESDLHGMGVSIGEDGSLIGWRSRLVKTGIRMVREEWLKIAAEAERLISEVGDIANEFKNAA